MDRERCGNVTHSRQRGVSATVRARSHEDRHPTPRRVQYNGHVTKHDENTEQERERRMSLTKGRTDLHRAMSRVAELVESSLDALLPDASGPESRLFEAMRYATLGGGKRMRAFLAIESAAMFAVSETSAARVGAAIEMLHAYSLIHDDLPSMDNDDLRRGKPSCHRAFDEATAILAGDALQTRAFELLAEPDTHSDPQARCELVHALGAAAGARGMVGGQMMDMMSEGSDLDAVEVTRLQALKTGRLIQFSAEAGAILGRAAPAQRHMLAAYGRDLGAAFQIADDLLDAEGTTEETGKTAGKDAAAGKATLVAILGPRRARQQADMLARQAASHLESFGEAADHLRALASYVVSRRS
jgi:farnesyl diphosphate synthase